METVTESNKIVQSLWIGPKLSPMERLSIQSFLNNGHEFHLYTYGKVGGVPDGVVVKDANEIISLSTLHYNGFPKLALFADFFRYKLLLEKGGWWVDTDTVCIKPFDFPQDYAFSSELLTRDGGKHTLGTHVNNGNIKAPAGSPIMEYCWKTCIAMDIPNIRWGVSGPALMKSAVEKFGLGQYMQAPQIFCPVPPWDVRKFIDPSTVMSIPEEAHAIHLWNNIWAQNQMNKSNFPAGSMYGRLQQKFGPDVKPIEYIVRLHMETPFAAINGLFSGLVSENLRLVKENNNAHAAAQSPLMTRDLSAIVGKQAYHLPTRSKLGNLRLRPKDDPVYDDVACFGALRILKNQSVQAIAAMHFSRARGKKLRFHINNYADEAYSKNILSLLQAIFAIASDAELVVHPWTSHSVFLDLLATMTIGLQVSMSESANNISKDMASVGLPMVTSPEIKWIVDESKAYPTNADDIAEKMLYTIDHPELIMSNRRNIEAHNDTCFQQWNKMFGNEKTPKVLFLVQKSADDTGVRLAAVEDQRMLSEHGIESQITQTRWVPAEIMGAINEYEPTHVVSEAGWQTLKIMLGGFTTAATPIASVPSPVAIAPKVTTLNSRFTLAQPGPKPAPYGNNTAFALPTPATSGGDWHTGVVGKKIERLTNMGYDVLVCDPGSPTLAKLRGYYFNAVEERVETPSGQKILFCARTTISTRLDQVMRKKP